MRNDAGVGKVAPPVAANPPSVGYPMRDQPAAAKQAGSADPSHVRQIAPDSIAAPSIEGALQRIAPRPPLAAPINRSSASDQQAQRPQFGPPIPTGKLLYRPVASAAGVIDAEGYAVTLAGIGIVQANEACSDPSGRKWPCGAVARTEFRAWLRGRAVSCDVSQTPRPIATRCTLDGQDMALWLVENGWARNGAGQYDDAAAKAQGEHKGIYGPSPLEAQP